MNIAVSSPINTASTNVLVAQILLSQKNFWIDFKEDFWNEPLDVEECSTISPEFNLDPIHTPLNERQLRLIRQVRHYKHKMGRMFYKFKTPNVKSRMYVKGDSWAEFLNISDWTFRKDLSVVATQYGSWAEYKAAEDKFKGKPIVVVFDAVKRVPFWDFNEDYEEQFGKDFHLKKRKKMIPSQPKVTAKTSDETSGHSSGHSYTEIQHYNLLPQSPHLNSNQPELGQQEEEEFSLKEKKKEVASPILPIGEKETGKKANERSNGNKPCSACGTVKETKKRSGKKKPPKSRATEHQQNTVKRLQKTHQEVTGIPMAENLRDETIIMSFETFMRDFQGDFRKYHAYCKVMESSDFLMRRDSSSKFKAFFAWAMREWNVAKVKKGELYQLKLFYDDLVEALFNSVESLKQRIQELKASAEERALRLRILEKGGKAMYVSWIEGTKIVLEGGVAVFKVASEFAKMKVESEHLSRLRQVCEEFELKAEVGVEA